VRIVRPPLATVVLDRNGGLLGEVGTQKRSWVRLIDLPPYVGQAFVAIEDRRFYHHDGVDVIGVMGAVRDNILRGFGSRGASTITQQLVGAMFPEQVDRREISLSRKVREAELARALERTHTKAEILEAYLNYINFGHGWYGVQSAARHYFGRTADQLSLPEAALLAALPKSPVQYDPRARPAEALRRRNLVLGRMQEQGYITPAQRRAAAATPLRLAPDEGYSVRAPDVVEWVRRWMVERYGFTAVNSAGMTVLTTLDPDLQRAADAAIRTGLTRIESLPGYHWPRYGTAAARPIAGRTPYLQGLLVALDPAAGDVLALIGGRDHGDSEFNRAVQGLRQAGSAFKPIVYATAFTLGVLPNAVIEDAPLSLPAGDGTRWTPENSDGTWSGKVTLRTALARSINIPAIKLALSIGLDSVIATARRQGLTTPIQAAGPTAIGAADVRPIELIAAYTAFATLGGFTPPRVVTLVQDAHGTPVWEAPPPAPQPAVDPVAAFQVTDLLQEAVLRGTGAAVQRAGLPTGLPVAGKTGTTNDNADVWFIGYTPNLVAGVWIGFDQRQTIMRGAYGGTLAAPIWGEFARLAYRARPVPPPWVPPVGAVAARVRRADGVPAPHDSTDAAVTEWFREGTEPTARAIGARLLRRLWFGVR
jgi:penicillin-binding protein 1A